MEKALNTNHQTTAGGSSATKKAVAKGNGQAGVPALDSAALERDAGAGLSNVTAQDLTIPRLKALMAQSHECNKTKTQYVEGAQPGMILNTVTQDLYTGDEGATVIPCGFLATYAEWSPIGEGSSAPANIYSSSSDILSKTTRDPKTNKDMLPNGNYIEKNYNFLVLVLSPNKESAQEALVTFKSTGLKVGRKWNSLMKSQRMTSKDGREYNPASFALKYKLGTMQESNERGSWTTFTINLVGPIDTDKEAEFYYRARDFASQIKKGDFQIAREEETPQLSDKSSNTKETPF